MFAPPVRCTSSVCLVSRLGPASPTQWLTNPHLLLFFYIFISKKKCPAGVGIRAGVRKGCWHCRVYTWYICLKLSYQVFLKKISPVRLRISSEVVAPCPWMQVPFVYLFVTRNLLIYRNKVGTLELKIRAHPWQAETRALGPFRAKTAFPFWGQNQSSSK